MLTGASMGFYLPPALIVLRLHLWVGATVGLILQFILFMYLARSQL
jgi:hypothetical protein